MVTAVYQFGWQYRQDIGFKECTEYTDFLSILPVKPSYTWLDITTLITQCFDREVQRQLLSEQGHRSNCIDSFQYGNTKWTGDEFPTISFSRALSQSSHPIRINVKGIRENRLEDLSCSSFVPVQTLEECLRILEREQKLLLTVHEEIEGKYIVSCLSRWIKTKEELGERSCEIITVEEEDSMDMRTLIDKLLGLGILYRDDEETTSDTHHIVVFDLDSLERAGCTSTIFDWMSLSDQKKKDTYCNGYEQDENEIYHINKDVTVIAYLTNNKVSYLSQRAYRLFKIISLPPIQHALFSRWLRQRLVQFTPQQVSNLKMLSTVKWLSEVYQNLNKSFSKIELINKLPDLSVYLNAPLANQDKLCDWVKELWSESITPYVRENVRQRTVAATEAQRELLIKTTLKTLFEKSIRAGCPVDLKFS